MQQCGFLCDQNLTLGVKLLAADLGTPIYPVVEHLLQLGAAQILPALQREELKKQLQEHLLVPSLGEKNQNDLDMLAKAIMKRH